MIEQKNKVLRISTAGSVDDGKSTLIGRMLYDTNSLKADKLEAMRRSSEQKGSDTLDFSLATDGLVAEREQGITIDVAHIYFSTANRSYIIADTPGHIEYTRNMVTGTSTSDVSIILIDARNGVIEQTKRHFFINSLLRTRKIIVAINKMDLVDYNEERFTNIVQDFNKLVAHSSYKEQAIIFIPISAKFGDNITEKSSNFPWYKGETLMQVLENIQIDETEDHAAARFQIQTVIRPQTDEFHDYRGYAGKLKGGEMSVGDEVVVLPSGTNSKIKSIDFYDKHYQTASRGSSITLTLEDDINVSRGDLIVKVNELPQEAKELKAIICWMDKEPLISAGNYLLQHGVKIVKSKIASIDSKLDETFTSQETNVNELKLNDLGLVTIKLAQSLNFDAYIDNKENGSFILIDTRSNTTAGVGFIQ
ncbi:MAG: GTP-binding protein [Brumimicrobium sp.]|nr:GTP-binding protein [Brumimicrobium sp.]MCO5269832.1 GTP-binding protein [Brumimicrobium sp.]